MHCRLRWGGARGLAPTPRLPRRPNLLSETGELRWSYIRDSLLLGNVPQPWRDRSGRPASPEQETESSLTPSKFIPMSTLHPWTAHALAVSLPKETDGGDANLNVGLPFSKILSWDFPASPVANPNAGGLDSIPIREPDSTSCN